MKNPAALAKKAIERALMGDPADSLPWEAPCDGLFLVVEDGAGRVRASLGTSRAEGASGALLARLASAAIDGDPRFPPLGPEDLGSVRVWILSAPRIVHRPEDLGPRDALRVTRGPFSGVFLPENYVGDTWDALSCLKQACRRAGLEAVAFERADTRIEAFSTRSFES